MHHKMVLLYKHVEGKKLSNCYWPRAARDLMLQMLTMAQDQGVEVDAELFNQLQAPTKNWIQRKYRSEILRVVASCSDLKWIPEQLNPKSGEQLVTAQEQVAWPEIDTFADISADPFQPVLCEDIGNWLRVNGPSGNDGLVAIAFDPDAQNGPPVIVLTEDDASAALWNENVASVSEQLSKTVASLLPMDICVAKTLMSALALPLGISELPRTRNVQESVQIVASTSFQ